MKAQRATGLLSPREAELRVYFGGHLEAAMGLRSWMGGLGVRVQTAPMTDARGLWAVRTEARVRASLEQLSAWQQRILRAAYCRIPPAFPAGLVQLGEQRLVMVVIAERQIRTEIAKATDPDRRRELELEDGASRLRAFVRAAGAKGPGRTEAKGALRYYRARAVHELREAQDAYSAAVEDRRLERRRAKISAFRASLGLP